jgi:hypothetical protein
MIVTPHVVSPTVGSYVIAGGGMGFSILPSVDRSCAHPYGFVFARMGVVGRRGNHRGAKLRTLTPHTLELFFPLLKTIGNNGSAAGMTFYTRRLLPRSPNIVVPVDATGTPSRGNPLPGF